MAGHLRSTTLKTAILFTNLWGNSYTLPIYHPRVQWSAVPGVYMFLKPSVTRPGYWDYLYVGQAHDLRERLGSHERWGSAYLRGCTAIAAVALQSPIERDALERDMIESLCPIMNTQHNRLVGLLG